MARPLSHVRGNHAGVEPQRGAWVLCRSYGRRAIGEAASRGVKLASLQVYRRGNAGRCPCGHGSSSRA
jgi:hypothetical protein